jgi:deazaflavin-dependent oxidoreductase (nitroreductase family)
MPSDFQLKTMNAVHRVLLKLSGGRVGRSISGMTVVELTTIGRKSGQPRTVLLTSPVQEDGAYLVVASRGGDDTHPAWFLNLRDNPEVKFAVQGEAFETRKARIVTSEERTRLWPKVTAAYKGYASYQEKTDREIPLVFLEKV